MDRVAHLPLKIPTPWATGAKSGFIRQVPNSSQIGIANGAASYIDGFPPLTFTPVSAGGVPPFGADMNGALNQITQWSRWVQAGGPIRLDALFQSQIGGYPQEARVGSNTVPYLVWQSTANNNASNPDAGGGGWQTPVFPDVSVRNGAIVPGLTVSAAAPGSQTSLGAHIALAGNTIQSNGVTTVLGPKKWIRVYNGSLQIINDSYGAIIFDLDNTGNLTAIHDLTAGGAVTGSSLTSHGDATVATKLQAGSLSVSGAASTGDLTVNGQASITATLHAEFTVQVDGTLTVGAVGRGQVELVSDTNNPGHIRFYTRTGNYVGFIGDGAAGDTRLHMVTQNGWTGWYMNGSLDVDGAVNGGTVGASSVAGWGHCLLVQSGNNTQPGYVAWFNPAGTRVGYFGVNDKDQSGSWVGASAKRLMLVAENPYNGFYLVGGLEVSGTLNATGIHCNGNIGIEAGHALFANCNTGAGTAAMWVNTTNTNGALIAFEYGPNPATWVGAITTDSANTFYGTASDADMKEDAGPIDSGGLIDALAPKWFRWRDRSDDNRQPGFFAQEVNAVFPWAVREGHGAPGDDDHMPWLLDPAKLMPLVIAELQSARRRLAALEAR